MLGRARLAIAEIRSRDARVDPEKRYGRLKPRVAGARSVLRGRRSLRTDWWGGWSDEEPRDVRSSTGLRKHKASAALSAEPQTCTRGPGRSRGASRQETGAFLHMWRNMFPIAEDRQCLVLQEIRC